MEILKTAQFQKYQNSKITDTKVHNMVHFVSSLSS